MATFYDVKAHESVEVPDEEVIAVRYRSRTASGAERVSYALKAERDGRRLTKFCSRAAWESHPGEKRDEEKSREAVSA